MNTVTDLSDLRSRVVRDQYEIDRLRWFQMQRYYESGLQAEPPSCLPEDPSVANSVYFGVYSEDQIQATARIVKTGIDDLPMLDHHVLYPAVMERFKKESDTLAEVSRLAVGAQAPHYRALSLLCREFFHYGVRHQEATLQVASVEKPMVRILNRILGIPVEIIGPEISQYGDFNGAVVPVLIDNVRCLDVTRRRVIRKWEFFTDGLVIDLTNELTTIDLRDNSLMAAS